MNTLLNIGATAQATGVKVPTIRYYEEIGLLRAPVRTESNRRLYNPDEVQRLRFIRHARELGFDIEAIRTLIELQDDPGQPCEAADTIAQIRLTEIKQRIASLKALQKELERMTASCAHGVVRDCKVIEVLADHGKCMHHG